MWKYDPLYLSFGFTYVRNQTKQPFLLKVKYKEQRSEYMTPFTSHSGLRTLQINRILYHSVLLWYEILATRLLLSTLFCMGGSPDDVGEVHVT